MSDTLDYLDIEGGRNLSGTIRVSGAKNSCLPIMAASLLTAGTSYIENVPRLRDVFTLIKVLESLNARVDWTGSDSLKIDTIDVNRYEPDISLVRQMRASVLVLGPLVARFGYAVMPSPGGCSLGTRPVDMHFDGMQSLGAIIEPNHEATVIRTDNASKLHGETIRLGFPSVGATENIMMAASLAVGTTTIENAAKEPEILDLAEFLLSMGAIITGAGEDKITITGVSELHPSKHKVIPDRVEAATYMIACGITAGNIKLTNVRPDHMTATLEILSASGCRITTEPETISVDAPDVIRPVDIRTLPYPGFSTDVQPPFMAMMTKASGESIFVEKIFERRLLVANELVRMGAEVRVVENCALVNGGRRLRGCEVNAPDIRAAAALVIGGLWADGRTRIRGLNHLYRGYEDIVSKLRSLGAMVEEGAAPVNSISEASGA
jgi:UDP-N-acetylglucosamine 1-carboxyvinyltransferase